MQDFPDDWDLKTRIEYLQRKVILNSIAYYMYDVSFISDGYFNSIAQQLAKMMAEYGDIKKTRYGYVFVEFDGSTGFDLYYRLKKKDRDYLTGLTLWQIERQKRGGADG